jgi:hypothetical protein
LGFEVGGVDHQLLRLVALGRQFGEDLVEHVQPAPADESVVDRVDRAIVRWRTSPPKAIPDHGLDPRERPPIIHSRIS